MKRILLPLLLLAGCATVEKIDGKMMTRFEMTGDKTFKATTHTANPYPPDDEKAEAMRMEWIRQYSTLNNCAQFSITSRVWTQRSESYPNVGTIVYSGECLQ